ncbi:MAG: hypothetical protein JXA50_10645 [Deltaproteobacteria bacterium]|nr:hypothetical protein [Deltaproteobacteria bacterium]
MAKGLMGIVAALVFLLSGLTPFAWGEVRQVTILYSNSINGQIYPAG